MLIQIGATGAFSLNNLIISHLAPRLGYHYSELESENQIILWEDGLDQITKGPCPKLVIGNWRYIDFNSYGFANPLYVSLTRDPFDRLRTWFQTLVKDGEAPKFLNNHVHFQQCLKAPPQNCYLPQCTMLVTSYTYTVNVSFDI